MRARAKRRARQRIDAKEIRDVWRGLAAGGVSDRIRAVNAAVDPLAPMFWYIFKLRLAAREEAGAVKTAEAVREVAEKVLAEDGHDLSGITLKVTWRPPVLGLEAVPEHTLSLEVVTGVRASAAGMARDRVRVALSRR